MSNSILRRGIMATALVAGIVLAGHARAQGTGEQAGPIEQGKKLYTKFCASCHGVGGKGDGPMGKALSTQRSLDLTTLAKNAGGKFPTIVVIESIDGTNPILGHGSVEMPVWGERFNQTGIATTEYHAQIRGYILLITQYLASIQAK